MSFTFGSNNQSHPLLGDGNTTDNKVSSAGSLAVGAGTASASVQKLAGVSNVSSNKVPPTALASIPNVSPNKVSVNNAALALPNKVVTIGGDSASLSSDSSANSNIASNKINSKVGSAEPVSASNQNVSNDDDVNIGSSNMGNSSDAITATASKVASSVAAQTAHIVASKVATTAATSAVASQVANAVSAQLATTNQKEGFGTCGMNNDHMWLLWLVIVSIICYLAYNHYYQNK